MTATKPTSTRTAHRTRERLISMQWSIRPEILRSMIAIVERRGHEVGAIAQDAGEWHKDTYSATVRDGIAYIPVSGVLSRYMTFFTAICGGQSYERIGTDLGALLADPKVKAVVWDIDSPGGEVNGCSELARMIFAARSVKPQIAFISGDGCSAAYWVASACGKVYASDTAIIGCLGCQVAYLDSSKALEREGYEEVSIVSSQTPNKNLDPATDAGRASVQRTVDALADRFIDAVAEYRGVEREFVLDRFGKGDVFVGGEATPRKMIDGVTTLEQLHATLTAGDETAATGARNARRSSTTRTAAMKSGAPKRVTALAVDDDVVSLVTRDVSIAEGDTGTITEVYENTTLYCVKGPNGEYRYLADDEIEAAGADSEADAAPAEAAPTGAAAAAPEPAPAAGRITTVAALGAAYPDLVAAIRQEEQARIVGILELAPAGQQALARECVTTGLTVDASARKFLEATRVAGATRLAGFTDADRTLFTPPATEVAGNDDESVGAVVASKMKNSRLARGEKP